MCRHEGTSQAMLLRPIPECCHQIHPAGIQEEFKLQMHQGVNLILVELEVLLLYKDRFHHHHSSVQADEKTFALSLWRIPGFSHKLWNTTQSEEWRNLGDQDMARGVCPKL